MAVIKLDELTYPKVAELLKAGKTTLLWPVGTMEAHGRHAPIGTDNVCAEEIAWRLGERLGWPVAPTLNYGITVGLIAYPGSVRIDANLYRDLVTEILENFFAIGFRRIVIINGHGGNTETLTKVVKDLIVEDRGNRHMIVIDWWQLDAEILSEVYGRPGGHAALDETACVLAFRPELVDPSAATKEHQSKFTPGVVTAPYSAAMLVYDDGDASPDFDRQKASTFMAKLLDKVESILRHEVELFERSFADGRSR
jgi:creatinine amidohydrolase